MHHAAMPPAAADSAAAPAPFRPAPPVVLGVLGGIAAGKSAVAARFATHGLCHVDADQIARARFVVDTDGDLPAMHHSVAAVLDQLRQERP